jgi:LysM repeat protein
MLTGNMIRTLATAALAPTCARLHTMSTHGKLFSGFFAAALLTLGGLAACASAPTPTAAPGATPTATPGVFFQLPIGNPATPTHTLEPEDTPVPSPTPGPVFTEYRVRFGDTLGAISARNNITIEELMRVNGLTDPHSLQIGQVLRIPTFIERVGPELRLLPDSEVVYGPAYKDFSIKTFLQKYPDSFLSAYIETVDREQRSGPEIIELVAERFSVGPRVLLALLEMEGGWVTSSALTGNQIAFPFGYEDGARTNLYRQAAWAANQINAGYYGKLSGRLGILDFADNQRARLGWSINPGTAAIHNVLSKIATWDEWQGMVSQDGFLATYQELFGDPYQYEFKPLLPKDLVQPKLRLPLEDGKLWYFTGGPHAGWVDGSPWAAVDFAPADQAGSCWPSQYWIVAAAPGTITSSEFGRVVQDLDGDGFQGTGWALLYMHNGAEERVEAGKAVKMYDHIGHPSCEGGAAETSHLHFARLYNGQWVAADDPKNPLVLSGWTFDGDTQEYDGTMTREDKTRTAENQRLEDLNGVIPDGGGE